MISSNDPNNDGSTRASVKDSYAYNMWNQVIELFDKDGPYLTVDTGSLAFFCLNFLRFISIILVIPVWLLLGVISFGLLWPPQVRQKLLRQRISIESRSATVKAEKQKDHLEAVQRSMAEARQELTTTLTRQKEQVESMKNELAILHSDMMSEMQHVKDTLESLLQIHESQG